MSKGTDALRVTVYGGREGGLKALFHLLPLLCDSDVVDYLLDIMCKNVNE